MSSLHTNRTTTPAAGEHLYRYGGTTHCSCAVLAYTPSVCRIYAAKSGAKCHTLIRRPAAASQGLGCNSWCCMCVQTPYDLHTPAGVLAFRQLLHGVMLRRTKDAVADQLDIPPCDHETIRVKLSTAERAFYHTVERKYNHFFTLFQQQVSLSAQLQSCGAVGRCRSQQQTSLKQMCSFCDSVCWAPLFPTCLAQSLSFLMACRLHPAKLVVLMIPLCAVRVKQVIVCWLP